MKTLATSIVQYDSFSDEYFIVIPDDIVDMLHLAPGDTLIWEIQGDKVFITKQEPTA